MTPEPAPGTAEADADRSPGPPSRCDAIALAAVERRRVDRRRRRWWSVLYGGFRPRRRGARHGGDADAGRYQSLDWHSSHLLIVAIAILLLCVGDAALTLVLLSAGALEVNPVMGLVVDRNAALFAVCKTTLTGGGVVLLVAMARYRFLRRFRVEVALYLVLGGYLLLIGYELWLMRRIGVTALL
jgi:Domain of unknown function (DUF5658)